MPLELRLLTGLGLAMAVVYSATPIAIRVADRLQFYDRPVGYKAHASPTPYLGGAAVICGFVLAVSLLGGQSLDRTLPLLGGTVLMWLVGTWDDRRTVTPRVRVGIELALSAAVWALGLGWQLGLGSGVDLVVTAVWIVAVVNAFNLFDNMDGATPSMGIVAAAALAVLGVVQGNTWLAVSGAALCGACAGFLPHNLSRPARIFLGDGGSLPIGFAVATLTMVGVSDSAAAWQSLAMGLLFVGVPALDTALVLISRRRRGISLLTAGRDHLTHRTHGRLRTARAVAIALGSAQAIISVLAVGALYGGSRAVLAAVVLYLVGACVAITVLDSRWAPVETRLEGHPGAPAGELPAPRRRRTATAAPATAAVALVLGAAPFFHGYYDSAQWVPAGLVLVAALIATVIAAPPRLDGPAALLLAGIAALAVWSGASSLWADSIEQAVVEADRLVVYAALAGVLLALLRTEAASVLLLGSLGAAAAAVAAYVAVRMLGADGGELFLGGRLHEPLGYINGEAAFFLLGLWCCVAVAEQRRRPWLSAAGAAAATLLACMVLLSQSRGVAIAALASLAVVAVAVPGRLRRAALVATLVGAGAAAAPALLDVYDAGRAGGVTAGVTRSAAWSALLAALGAGAVWGLASFLAARRPRAIARVRPVAVAALAAAGLAVAVAGVAERDRITGFVDRQYTTFTTVDESVTPDTGGVSRLASGAGNRYDYWRIAWGAFEERPVVGIGAGNYDRRYFERRATQEDVQQPHSLPLQVLGELGLVGLVLLLAAAVGLVWGAGRAARAARDAGGARFAAVAGIGVVTAWAVQASVDWLHLLPGLTGFGLAAAAVLVRDRAPARAALAATPGAPARAASRLRLVAAAVVAIALAAAATSLARQGLAERFRAAGQDALAERPEEALRQADRSLRLDPEATAGYYLKASALARFDQPRAARAALEEAARREPGNFVTWALLGDIAARTGDTAGARRGYRRALALNPRDPGLQAQAEALRARR